MGTLSSGMSCSDLHEYTCSSGYCVETSVVCDYTNDCLDNSDEQPERCFEYTCRCDMEDASTCHWNQDIDDDTDWVIMRAASDNEGLMPTTDHTLGTGEGKQNLSYSCCHQYVEYQLYQVPLSQSSVCVCVCDQKFHLTCLFVVKTG